MFKVGEVVQVREDLVLNQDFGSYYINDSMLLLIGRIVTIRIVLTDVVHKKVYKIVEGSHDVRCAIWTKEMLEPVLPSIVGQPFRMGLAILAERNNK